MSVTFCPVCKITTERVHIPGVSESVSVHKKCEQVAQRAIKEEITSEKLCMGCVKPITIYQEGTLSSEGGVWHNDCLKKSLMKEMKTADWYN